MSAEVVQLMVPGEAVRGREPLRFTAPDDVVPNATIAAALRQVMFPTPQMIEAADKLREELDLLHRGRPTDAAIFMVMAGAWITHHSGEAACPA